MKKFSSFKNITTKKFYIVSLVILIILNSSTLIILFSVQQNKTEKSIQKFPLIDPSRHLISQDDYIVNIQPLRESIRKMAAEFENGQVSIYIEFLNTGANISINQDVYILPASLTKVPLALAVMKKVENGEWDLNSELVLMPGDANQMSGDEENPLHEFPVGTRFTIEKLLEELLINSDNTAYYILLRNLHKDDLNLVINAIGLQSLFTQDGKMSAKEYSRILRALYTASFLSRVNSQYILDILDKATFNQFLATGVPNEVPFPHKFGEDDLAKVYSDSGIVYIPNRPYIISVMVEGDKNTSYEDEQNRAAEFMSLVSHEVYQYFSTAKN